jgi:thymidylate kinase
MEVYETWARMLELQKYYSWIVDRFHISTQAHQKHTYNKDYNFRWLEERLLPLNFRIVFCTRSPESFEAAREERLKVSGNPSQYNDLTPFIREQELMRELIAKSMLPSLTLDVSDNNIPAAVERVADWLETSGGLYMPD